MKSSGTSFKMIERPLYGSSRLGNDNTQIELVATLPQGSIFSHISGLKEYELSNHLGNVHIKLCCSITISYK